MSILPLALLGFYNLRIARQNLETSISYHHALGISQVADNLTSLLNELQHSLKVLAVTSGSGLAAMPARERAWLLDAARSKMPDVRELLVVDSAGHLLAQVSGREVLPPQQFQPDLYAAALHSLNQGQTYQGSVYFTPDKEPVFQLAVPLLPEPDGHPGGGLIALVSLRNIIDRLTAIPVGPGGYLFLVDGEGRLIGHEDYSQVLQGRDVRPSLAALAIPSAGGGLPSDNSPSPFSRLSLRANNNGLPAVSRYQSYTGQEVIGAAAPVGNTGWRVIIEQPVANAYAPFHTLIRNFTLGALAIILLVLAVSLAFGLRFSRKLEELEEGVHRVAAGELGYNLPGAGEDELGQVISAFNQLSQELQQKKGMEVAIRQADKMVTVGLLAAGVAHEINNPLATISLSTEDLLERLQEEDINLLKENGELSQYLKLIHEQAGRCAGITRRLLDFARQREYKEELYDLNQVIQDVLTLPAYKIRKEKINVETFLDPAIPSIYGDREGIMQVVFNLVCNALQALPRGGHLTVTSKLVDTTTLALTVQDDGTGIPPEALPHVFEPFFTTKPPGQGTGLGLSVCYGIVTAAGGQIDISSQPGQGTRVDIKLPLTQRIAIPLMSGEQV
ncbi:two-component sensor histidine kinase [Moorella sp. Hama-1]|nr:two-component sensor histidine kinase [Moorella sp. Hama-1]